jgi:hypothetical protein
MRHRGGARGRLARGHHADHWTEPAHGDKIPLPGGSLGLERQSWIVTSELNVTRWPGHDLRPALRPSGAWWRYGRLSDVLRQRLADAVQAKIQAAQAKVVIRT